MSFSQRSPSPSLKKEKNKTGTLKKEDSSDHAYCHEGTLARDTATAADTTVSRWLRWDVTT